MKGDSSILDIFTSYLPTGIVLLGVIVVGVLARLLINRVYRGKPGRAFTKQIITFGLIFAAVIGVLAALPIRDTLRGQLFTLFGIIISALIALSSSTFVGNAMAGLMLRSVKNFKPGDFLSVGDHFGRVSDRGLFHTEIQTINRDLVTIPNQYLVNNPVSVIRTSGTFISGDVSLGYDVSREPVEEALIRAAENAELKEPFVHILDLGDFSITYRVYGLLEDVKYLVGSRSQLKKCMLDSLHHAGIEIVSPHFRNQRSLKPEEKFIPPEEQPEEPSEQEDSAKRAETLAFDKAEEAESLEKLREKIAETEKQIEELKEGRKKLSSEGDKNENREEIESLESRKKRLTELVQRREEEKRES